MKARNKICAVQNNSLQSNHTLYEVLLRTRVQMTDTERGYYV